jgi:uncharacterized protein with NRDE domain
MCVIYLAYKTQPDYPLILLANRDEFYSRPTASAAYWTDFPNIYGGRDLVSGGTWLGVTKGGRLAAVTNYRDPSAQVGGLSRGNLVADFLKSDEPASEYLDAVQKVAEKYSGFNLIIGEINTDRNELYYFSNRGGSVIKLDPGIYSLSNHLLDTPWPKVKKGKDRFAEMLRRNTYSNEAFFDLLADRDFASDADLPSTGVPSEWEKVLSAIFIETPDYGTRCSTVLKFNSEFEWDFEERVFV